LHLTGTIPGVRPLLISLAAAVVAGAAVAGATAGRGQDARPRPLGSLAVRDVVASDCPPGSRCTTFTVACPGVQERARSAASIRRPTVRARGVVVFFSGAAGKGWWAKSDVARDFLSALTRAGFITAQVAWKDSWLRSAPGEQVGPAVLGCRPATVIAWLYATVYRPLRLARPATGLARCGFCVTGNSGGATQAAYALTHYELDRLLDSVVLTGGPPHGSLAKGCLRRPADSEYWYSRWAAAIVDASYGFRRDAGPCALADATFAERWQRDSVATGGIDYEHPRTRVVFLFGRSDGSEAVPHGKDYAARLRLSSPAVRTLSVRAAHQFALSPSGLAVLRQILLGPPP
jgi:hypothetical protein